MTPRRQPDGPKTIADVFDLQKFPGKRGLQKNPFVNLEWALIADGVPQADVYKVLATPEGVDRAFKKLDTIKKEVVWWEAGAQPPQLLADGQVVMTSAWNGRIHNAIVQDKKPFADHVGPAGLRLGLVGDPEGRAQCWKAPTGSSAMPVIPTAWRSRPSTFPMARPTRTPFRTSAADVLAEFADRRGEHDDRAHPRPAILGRQR